MLVWKCLKAFGIFSLSIISFFVIWSLTILAKYLYTAWPTTYWVWPMKGVNMSWILYVLVSFLYIPNSLFVANVEQNVVLILFQFFWMSSNLSDSILIFDRFIKNYFQWKFFSFVDLRIEFVSLSVCRGHPFTDVEPLCDSLTIGHVFQLCLIKFLISDYVDYILI